MTAGEQGHGDAAYVEYVSAQLPRLRRSAFLLCGDWARGDDLVQRVLTDVYVSWRRLGDVHNLDAYVRKVLIHRFIDERRRGWARVRLVWTVPERPVAEGPDGDAGIDLRSALDRLPPRQRAVLVLRYFYDLSIEQTAVALRCSTGTVKSQTSRALAAMRNHLEFADGKST